MSVLLRTNAGQHNDGFRNSLVEKWRKILLMLTVYCIAWENHLFPPPSPLLTYR